GSDRSAVEFLDTGRRIEIANVRSKIRVIGIDGRENHIGKVGVARDISQKEELLAEHEFVGNRRVALSGIIRRRFRRTIFDPHSKSRRLAKEEVSELRKSRRINSPSVAMLGEGRSPSG